MTYIHPIRGAVDGELLPRVVVDLDALTLVDIDHWVAGLLYTVTSSVEAFAYLAVWMLTALTALNLGCSIGVRSLCSRVTAPTTASESRQKWGYCGG